MCEQLCIIGGRVGVWLTEQSRVTASYMSDACDARLLQQTNVTSCDDVNKPGARDSVSPIPVIVPCSFVPQSPRFLDGKHRHRYSHLRCL